MVKTSFYATGRRKTSSARVWIKPGTGVFSVNGHSLDIYFKREVLRMLIEQPLKAISAMGEYDMVATVTGGGLSGQAGAVRHGLSRALVESRSECRGALKKEGFLTRDARMVERKKYGMAGARRRFQYSKR